MKKNSLKAVLNMHKLNVPAKISKARLIINAISVNAAVFTAPNPALAVLTNAANDLETAWDEATDGGKSKKAIMYDKEAELLKLMNDTANYVEAVADGNEAVIHMAAMETKKMPNRVQNEFEVLHNGDSGTVTVKRKAVAGAAYKWQFSKDPFGIGTWEDAGTTLKSKVKISGLLPAVTYWFRVAIIDKMGTHEYNNPISIIVI